VAYPLKNRSINCPWPLCIGHHVYLSAVLSLSADYRPTAMAPCTLQPL